MSIVPNRTFAAALALLAAATPGLAAGPASTAKLKPYASEFQAEAKSRSLCEREPERLFVEAGRTSECVAYFVTRGNETVRHAVLFMDGDVSLERYQDKAGLAAGRETKRAFMQTWADKTGIRYIDISRLGVNGSSGNHGKRRMPHETIVMNAAIDLLKAKLGLDTVTLAGQSGGSTIAASLLTFGRLDIACAALGSGAFELVELEYAGRVKKGARIDKARLAETIYDPSQHVDSVAPSSKRRIFVLGDPADSRTPFDQQQRFTNALRAAGHHARIYPINAGGDTDHDAHRMTLPIAGVCARGDSDEKIYKGTMPKDKVAGSAPASARQASSSN